MLKKDRPCAWCGKSYEDHDDFRGYNVPVPRVPCSLLKSGYRPKLWQDGIDPWFQFAF